MRGSWGWRGVRIQSFIRTIAPKRKVVAAIRADARKRRKDQFSIRQIDAEISAYRREAIKGIGRALADRSRAKSV